MNSWAVEPLAQPALYIPTLDDLRDTIPASYEASRASEASELQDYNHRCGRQTWMRHRNPHLDLGNLLPHCYEGNTLAGMLIKHANISLRKKLVPDEILLLQRDFEYCPDSEWTQRVLSIYLDILDKAFFFGAVGKQVKIEVEERKDQPYRACYHTLSRTIVIVLQRQSLLADYAVVKIYIANLLHEMLHAFLHIYSCQCEACRSNGNDVVHCNTTGHREQWVESLLAIQRALFWDLGWRSLDVGISRSVNYEIKKTDWRPTRGQLKIWGVVLTEEHEAKYTKIEQARWGTRRSWIY